MGRLCGKELWSRRLWNINKVYFCWICVRLKNKLERNYKYSDECDWVEVIKLFELVDIYFMFYYKKIFNYLRYKRCRYWWE